ncbi:MAG: sulfite exporter TauE/SafE family protein [Magnetococcales bacterium]|nr:sulfite exporter TauE/SafE family protein [Magnetococcales bacterium]
MIQEPTLLFEFAYTPLEILAATAAMILGSLIQGAVGFGAALVVAPVLVAIDPRLVPGAGMVGFLFITMQSWLRERNQVVWAQVSWATVGRIPGSFLGAYILILLPLNAMGALVGSVVILGVLLSVCGWNIPIHRRSLVGAGVLSGVAGTISSVGGPPLALLYQNSTGPHLRATLGAYFTIAILTSLPLLYLVDRFHLSELIAGLVLAPGVWLGMYLSKFAIPYLDGGYTRMAVLWVCGASGLWVMVDALYNAY